MIKVGLLNKRFQRKLMIIWAIILFVLILSNHKGFSAVSLNLYSTYDETAGFMSPNGITADNNNNVYIADFSAGKIFKLTPPPNINITTFITIAKPVALAYYNNKIYVFSLSEGGKSYNVSDGSYANISFGTGYGDYRDVKKPADMVIDNSGNIYVADMEDNLIKKYNASGSFVEAIGGPYPADCRSVSDCGNSYYGNGLFYILSTLAFDSSTNRLIVGDMGNPTPYIQIGAKATPVKSGGGRITSWTWTKSAKVYGRPKGKVQVYDIANATWLRQAVTHGSRSSYGQALTVSGLWVDTTNNLLYLVDSANKKIVVIDNIANDSKTYLWTSRSAQDQQELKINEVAIADSPTEEPINSPSRYAVIQGVYDLSGNFSLLKDVIKVGNYLVVTDRFGKVYYFTISVN